jgi:SH3 domain-containing YSC84-like protein 1
MKKMWLSMALVSLLALPALAQDKETDRVRNAGKVMQEILNAPDSIPQSVLDKADCVVILPSVLKFAFIFGGSYGRGAMTCRGGTTFHGRWGAPTMIALGGGSAGLQIGGNATDFVLLLMSPRSATSILKSKVKLGGDAFIEDRKQGHSDCRKAHHGPAAVVLLAREHSRAAEHY